MSEQSHLSLRKKKLFESRNCISIALNTTKTFLENKNWIVTKLFFLNHDFLDIIIKTTPLKLYSVSLRFNQKKEKKKKLPLTPPPTPLLPQLSLVQPVNFPQSLSPQHNIPIVFQTSLEKRIFPHIYILMYSHSVACEIAIGQTVLNGAVLAVRCHRCSEQGDINVGSGSKRRLRGGGGQDLDRKEGRHSRQRNSISKDKEESCCCLRARMSYLTHSSSCSSPPPIAKSL